MEQKFSTNSILGRAKRLSRADFQVLREFFASRSNFVRFACKESGIAERCVREAVSYRMCTEKNSATFFK